MKKRLTGPATLMVVATLVACGSSKAATTPTTPATAAPAVTQAPAGTSAPVATSPATSAGSAAATTATAAATAAPTTVAGVGTTLAASAYDHDASLRIGQPARPAALYPHKGASPTIDFTYMSPFYDRLVELNGNGSISPMVATSWTEAADGKSTTFKLRTDVKFWDGTPLNADAVVTNLKTAYANDTGLSGRNLRSAFVTSIEKVDDATVKINTSESSPLLPYWLAVSMEAGGLVNPLALGNPDKLATTPAGSGPMKLVEVGQDRIIYSRNDDYWDKEVVASSPKRLEQIGFGDEKAEQNALLSGQIDLMAVQTPIDNLDDFLKKNNLNKFRFEATARALAFYTNIKVAPLDNVKVRQALSLAIDRKSISQLIGADYCIPTVQPFGKGYPGYDPSLDAAAQKYDPDAAKKMLSDAGVTSLSVEAITTESALFKTVGEAVQGQWSKIGVNLKVTVVPTQQSSPEFASGKYPFYASSLTGNVEPGIFVTDIFLTRGSPGGVPPELQTLATKAAVQKLGSPERVKAYQDVAKYIAENPVHLIICTNPNLIISKKNVVGIDRDAMLALTNPIDSRHIGIIKA